MIGQLAGWPIFINDRPAGRVFPVYPPESFILLFVLNRRWDNTRTNINWKCKDILCSNTSHTRNNTSETHANASESHNNGLEAQTIHRRRIESNPRRIKAIGKWLTYMTAFGK